MSNRCALVSAPKARLTGSRRHRYGPIAGSVEPEDEDPLATAWREMREETTLTSASLEVFRVGKPYSFVDAEIGRQWTINPFSFRLKPVTEGGKGEDGITIDWEHESWDWFDPSTIVEDATFGVPRLTESLRRCWFEYDLGAEIGTVLSQGLDELKTDHESGARQLAGKALETLIAVAQAPPPTSAEQWWKHVRMAAWHLWKNGRESMGAATLNVMIAALELIERKLPEDSAASLAPEFLRGIETELQEYSRQRHHAVDGIWDSFQQVFRSTRAPSESEPSQSIKILTLSLSSTIATCLERAVAHCDKPLEIRILESRPLFEGVSLASKLLSKISKEAASGTTVTLYTDAAAAVAASGVDILLLGADLIGGDGAVSNKVGSLPTALALKRVSPSAKVVVLAEREKVLPLPPPREQEENSSKEMLAAWHGTGGIKNSAEAIEGRLRASQGDEPASKVSAFVRNVYFEWVPADLVDDYIFDDMPRKSDGLLKLSDEIKAKYDRFFEGL